MQIKKVVEPVARDMVKSTMLKAGIQESINYLGYLPVLWKPTRL
jgi:hypothetical protein